MHPGSSHRLFLLFLKNPFATPALVLLMTSLAAPPLCKTQPFTRDSYSIPVTAALMPVDHPFSGGLYNPMHQFADSDTDGDLDLFIYEFNDGNLFFYRNTGTPQTATFALEPLSLPDVFGWFRLEDINGDQLLDLLTSSSLGNTLTIFLNTGTPQVPSFTLLTHALPDSSGTPVYSESYSIAALCDIDADGDPDFFSLNSSFGTINFYENIGSASNILLAFRTNQYQGIKICVGCGSIHPTENPHGNGTMYFADADGDTDFDMFYGDLFDPGLFFYQNIGTPAEAVLDSVTAEFPPNNPVITGGFNQPTLVDIDADGDLDLFVSVLYPLERIDNFRLYENVGTPQSYDFQLVSKNYLRMLDFGLQAAPAFADVDGDADPDMFVGDLDGHVAFLRNTGGAAAPSFNLEDSAFVSSTNTFTYTPVFADIDNDSDLDMFLGHFAGKIEFRRNEGTPSVPIFQRVLWTFDTTSVGNYAAPSFFDADDDGDLDLFIGKAVGTIAHYRNDGTPQSWRFSFVASSFQGIGVGSNSKPHFVDIDGDTRSDLLVGASDGAIHYYHNDGPPGNPLFSLVTRSFGDLDSVREAAPVMADIDADGDLDLLLGNYRGGVEFYRNGPSTSIGEEISGGLPDSPRLLLNYPNPFNSSTTILFDLPRGSGVELRIFDILGREVALLVDGILPPGRHQATWSALNSAGGTYFFRLRAGGMTATGKLMLLR